MKSARCLLIAFHVACASSHEAPDDHSFFLGLRDPKGDIIEDPKGLPPVPADEGSELDSAPAEDPPAPSGVQKDHHERAHHAEAVKEHHAEPEHGIVTEPHEEHHHEEHHHHEGAAHGEHAEHGEHGEHEALSPHEEALEAESFSLACFLMGGVGALFVVFYLVNSPLLGVRVSTWRVLNMTASIFVAVLMYGTAKSCILHLFEPGFRGTIAITLSMFVLCFVGSHAVLFQLKKGDPTKLQAAATIWAHVTGFAAMYGFADCQEVEMFEELDVTGIVLLIVVAVVVIAGLSYIMDLVMKKAAAGDGDVDEDEERWMDVCEETDNDVFCLSISFLLVLLIRFLIRGKVTAYEPGKVGNVTQSNANYLLAVAMCWMLLTMGATLGMMKFQSKLTSHTTQRIASNAQHLCSMTMAWCFLFWAEWQLYVAGWESTIIGGCLVVAVCLTMASFLSVFILDSVETHFRGSKMMKRAMGSLELALGVLVGFTWERAFDVGFEEFEHKFEHHAKEAVLPGAFWVMVMSLVLWIIVAPAWRYYILPKALTMEETEAKALET